MFILNKIIKLLDINNKTQKDLTDFLKLEKSTFSAWKNNKSQSYKKYLKEIAEFFKVSVDYLVGNEQSNNIDEEHRLSKQELEIINKFRLLDERGKMQVNNTIKTELENSQIIKIDYIKYDLDNKLTLTLKAYDKGKILGIYPIFGKIYDDTDKNKTIIDLSYLHNPEIEDTYSNFYELKTFIISWLKSVSEVSKQNLEKEIILASNEFLTFKLNGLMAPGYKIAFNEYFLLLQRENVSVKWA